LPCASQQPFGHDAASHTQAPEAPHSCPAAHATHAAPFLPHAAFVAVTHCPEPLQQPDAHDVPPHVHDPWLQDWPTLQAVQAAPCVPQAAAVGVDTQWPLPSQQPPGHDAASHVVLPPSLPPVPLLLAVVPPLLAVVPPLLAVAPPLPVAVAVESVPPVPPVPCPEPQATPSALASQTRKTTRNALVPMRSQLSGEARSWCRDFVAEVTARSDAGLATARGHAGRAGGEDAEERCLRLIRSVHKSSGIETIRRARRT
jgi:hypothetical protein